MKKKIILLINIINLIILNIIYCNYYYNNKFNNYIKINDNKDNLNKEFLFNNEYGYLNKGDWINNQSLNDCKFYSYNTNHANYLLNDGKTLAKELFSVNEKGELIYKLNAIIQKKDEIDLNNTKQEMIDNKQINYFKKKYNPYSNSIYNDDYFISKNEKWIFLQMGGIENHIDISKQEGGNKVENNNNLSELLGLYYIAKAQKQNKISQNISYNLGKWFINQSSLKGKISEKLINKIIDLINTNNNIYNFIYYAPFSNNSEKKSLNFIFDNNLNLIKIYYNKWNINNLKPIDVKNNLNIKSDISGAGIIKTNNVSSKDFFISWKKLKINNYKQFINAFYKINIIFYKFDILYNNHGEGKSKKIIYGFKNNINLNIIFNNDWYKSMLATYWVNNYFGYCSGELNLYTKYINNGIIFKTNIIVTGGGSSYFNHIYGIILIKNILFN